MSDKKRTKIGNALSKVLARIDTSTRKGSLQEAILNGDFFQDDFEKQFEPSEPSSPKSGGVDAQGKTLSWNLPTGAAGFPVCFGWATR